MTRKILLSIVLIILIFGCYILMFGNHEGIRQKVASINQLETSSKQLDTAIAQLERNCTTDYEEKKNQLEKIIKEYKEAKEEYDSIVPTSDLDSANELVNIEESNLKDIYDVGFLWTVLGNYATEEGVLIDLDILKNTTSASSMNNTTSNYIVCDLKFAITGRYINITDFIYDLEDDDRLNFEINNFEMQKDGDNLKVTLTVKEIKLNSSNLIDTPSIQNSFNDMVINTTQTIDSTTNTTSDSEISADVN